MMTVFIECLDNSSPIKEAGLKRCICRILEAEGYADYDLTLILADSACLRRLNKKYRNIDKVTDVISFAMLEGNAPPVADANLGDIYISLPRTRRQAREYRVSFEEELKRLMIHGLLHLLGYDHIKPGQAVRMRKKEAIYIGY
ncbi:MAG: rRNA maturation RNase YbeY [Candidatus Edwardsbacteria bacterium]|nr:rRNA maturation RNase YbeY [Candidatus Edwardsbacteria bacterium]MBU1577439.1 rRNA maturation RNase YbeY [Candidatus Edwardsbacteria bacterium]MBU2463227.1 rRNA maturation RNase YbeY [Candidatus Edwardsbacteria bacterium]MBU2593006.1 rRNA maturation RNase YbeY [Candidatus Edwardsbacteria bacterium]